MSNIVVARDIKECMMRAAMLMCAAGEVGFGCDQPSFRQKEKSWAYFGVRAMSVDLEIPRPVSLDYRPRKKIGLTETIERWGRIGMYLDGRVKEVCDEFASHYCVADPFALLLKTDR